MTFDPSRSVTSYGGRSLVGLPYDELQRYYYDPELDSYFRRHSSLFQPRAGIVSRLADPTIKCDRNLGWNIDWAVAFIVDHIDKKTDAASTFRSIRIKAAALEREGLAKDIPYRIFNKLDECLFASYLKNVVYVESSSLGSDVSGATYTQSWGPDPDVKRISIILNQDVLDFATARDIVAFLVHHMIHAYLLVACGPQKEDEVDYGRLTHGHHFGKILMAIKKLSAAHGKELTPLNFGHDLGEYRVYEDRYYNLYHRSEMDEEQQKQKEKEKWYCSHCHASLPPIPTSDIEKGYDKYIAPMHSQTVKAIRSATVQIYNDRRHEIETKSRERLPSSSKTVEFLFKDKAYLVETKKLENLLSIQRAFLLTSSRFLKLDAKHASKSTFHRFLEFIHTSCYRPDIPFSSTACPSSSGPILKPDSSTTGKDGPILADVQFVKFGTVMEFDECVTYAMKRLNAYAIVSEDPVTLLKEMYAGREPTKRLKDWTRNLLLAPYSSSTSISPLSYAQHGMVGCVELPNLLKLESEQYPWRTSFLDAVESSGSLENEVHKARQELREKGWGWEQGLLLGHGVGGMRRCGLGYCSSPNLNLLTLGGLGFGQQQQQQLLLGGVGITGTELVTPGLNSANLTGLLASSAYNPLANFSNNSSTALSSAIELEQLKNLERQKIRELEREKQKMKERERSKDRRRETLAQVQAAAFVDKLYGTGFRGFVESEDERY